MINGIIFQNVSYETFWILMLLLYSLESFEIMSGLYIPVKKLACFQWNNIINQDLSWNI